MLSRSAASFFGGMAQTISGLHMQRKQAEAEKKAKTEAFALEREAKREDFAWELEQRLPYERSLIQARAEAEPKTTFKHPDTGVVYSGLAATTYAGVFAEVEKKRQLAELGLGGEFIHLGGGVKIDKKGLDIFGESGSPDHSRAMLRKLDAVLPLYKKGGVPVNWTELSPVVKSWVNNIRRERLESPDSPKESRVMIEVADINNYPNILAAVKTFPQLKEIFQTGMVPDFIAGSLEHYAETTEERTLPGYTYIDDKGDKKTVDPETIQVRHYTPTGWRKQLGREPTENHAQVEYLSWNNIDRNLDSSYAQFHVKTNENKTDGIGRGMSFMYHADTRQQKEVAGKYLSYLVKQNYWGLDDTETVSFSKTGGNPVTYIVPENSLDYRAFIKSFAGAAEAMIPDAKWTKSGGTWFKQRAPHKDFILSEKQIAQAYEQADLGFELTTDLAHMVKLLDRPTATTSYQFGTQSWLDFITDPESGIVAAGKTLLETFGSIFKDQTSEFSSTYLGQGDISTNWRKSETNAFLNSIQQSIEEDMTEGSELDLARQAYQNSVKNDTKLDPKHQEVLERSSRRLLAAKLTYQFAAMFQGGAGGRMISDQDFKIVMTALFNHPNAESQKHALMMLKAKMELGLFKSHVRATYGKTGKAKEMIEKFQYLFDAQYSQAMANLARAEGYTSVGALQKSLDNSVSQSDQNPARLGAPADAGGANREEADEFVTGVETE